MFCKHCGHPIPEGGFYCTFCGVGVEEPTPPETTEELPVAPITPIAPTQPSQPTPAQSKGKSEERYFVKGDNTKETKADFHAKSAELDALLGDKASYYKNAFQKIQTTGETQMNWSAFWFTLPHAGYRNMWRVWLDALKYPIFLYCAVIVVTILGMGMAQFSLIALGTLGGMGAGVWYWVAQINYARQFNTMYMHQIDGILCGEISGEKVTDYGRAITVTAVASAIIMVLQLMQALAI